MLSLCSVCIYICLYICMNICTCMYACMYVCMYLISSSAERLLLRFFALFKAVAEIFHTSFIYILFIFHIENNVNHIHTNIQTHTYHTDLNNNTDSSTYIHRTPLLERRRMSTTVPLAEAS